MPLQLTPWQDPPLHPKLTEESVHLWRFPLTSKIPLENLINKEEQQRADRLRISKQAQTFVIARARLRQILASYLDLDPQDLNFAYGSSGKPSLIDVADAPSFNLAHSGNWALCAVSMNGEVGVDIEKFNADLDYAKLAERFFSATERKRLQDCPTHRRRRLFFRIWTRKEAWLKGKGGGFSDPDQDIGLIHLSGNDTHDGGWRLRSFPVDRHYLATLAVQREFPLVQRWDGWRSQD